MVGENRNALACVGLSCEEGSGTTAFLVASNADIDRVSPLSSPDEGPCDTKHRLNTLEGSGTKASEGEESVDQHRRQADRMI
jgi:hypothetical protein